MRILVLLSLCVVLAGAGYAAWTPPAKPLLLQLLETRRADFHYVQWLGEVMELKGPVAGFFTGDPAEASLDELALEGCLTPSDAPGEWRAARWQEAQKVAPGLFELKGDQWRCKVKVSFLGGGLFKAELSDLYLDRAYLDPWCLADLVLVLPSGECLPFHLLQADAAPGFRLSSEAVGNLAVGKESLPVCLEVVNPTPEPRSFQLQFQVAKKLGHDVVSKRTFKLEIPPFSLQKRTLNVKLPAYGIYQARLLQAGGKEVARLRLVRIPPPGERLAPDRSSFGVNVFQHQLWWYTFQVPLIAALGVRWVRPWLAWENTWRMQAPTPERWDTQALDKALNRLAQYGLAYEYILFASPEWAGKVPELASPPRTDALRDWADWVRRLAAHLRGRVSNFEVWNEPDLMWPEPGRDTPNEYLQLLEITRKALLSGNPEAVVEAPSSAGKLLWLAEAAPRACKLTDVFTFHVYTDPEHFLHGMRRRIDTWSGAEGWSKPVRLNEIGVSAADLAPDYNDYVKSDELAQATLLVAECALFLSERPEGKVSWFCTLDPHNCFDSKQWTWDGGIGLLYEGFLPKVAYAAYAQLTREVDGKRALGHFSPSPGVHVVAFEGKRAVVWRTAAAEKNTVPACDLGCAVGEKLKIKDLFGNVIQHGRAAKLELDLAKGPVYLEGSTALEAIARTWHVLTALRPPLLLAAGQKAQRITAALSKAELTCRVLQSAPGLRAEVSSTKTEWRVEFTAAPRLAHQLAYVELAVSGSGSESGVPAARERFPVTLGAPSLLDDPGLLMPPGKHWTHERKGGISYSPLEGHLAPGCLVLAAPYDCRWVKWPNWTGPKLDTSLPLHWTCWTKAEAFEGATVKIALALFAGDKWLKDVVLVTTSQPKGLPSGSSDWVKLEGTLPPEALPGGLSNFALYVDLTPVPGASPGGRLLLDELDLWQPGADSAFRPQQVQPGE